MFAVRENVLIFLAMTYGGSERLYWNRHANLRIISHVRVFEYSSVFRTVCLRVYLIFARNMLMIFWVFTNVCHKFSIFGLERAVSELVSDETLHC